MMMMMTMMITREDDEGGQGHIKSEFVVHFYIGTCGLNSYKKYSFQLAHSCQIAIKILFST